MIKSNKGITMIVLVLTIIILMILISIATINTIGDNGFLASSNESKFKEDIVALRLEFEKKMMAKSVKKDFKREDVYLDETTGDLSEYMESLKNNKYSKYKEILCINAGELCGKFDKTTEKQKEWLKAIGMDSTYLELSNANMWEIDKNSGAEDYRIVKYLGPITPDTTIIVPNKIIDENNNLCVITSIQDFNTMFEEEINIFKTLVVSSNIIMSCRASGSKNHNYVKVSKLILNDNVNSSPEIDIALDDFGDVISKNKVKFSLKISGNVNNFIAGDNCSFGYVASHNQNNEIKNLKLGNNANILGESFQYFYNVEKLEIGKGLKISSAPYNGYHALNMADNYTCFNIESFSKVEENVLRNCPYLTTITLEEGAEIKAGAFSDCSNITEVIGKNNITIGNSAFYNCTNLKEFELGDNCTFSTGSLQNDNLEKIKLGNNIKFTGHSSLPSNFTCEELIIGDNLDTYPYGFKNSTIDNITIGKNPSITSLLENCTVKNFIIGDGGKITRLIKNSTVTNFTIGNEAEISDLLDNNSTINTAKIGKNSTIKYITSSLATEDNYINDLLIRDDTVIELNSIQYLNLKNLILGNVTVKSKTLSGKTITSFSNCYGPENLTILDNAGENFVSKAFEENSYLKTLVLGNNVTTKTNMFLNCINLENIKIGENAAIAGTTFKECTGLTTVEIGNNADLGSNSFAGCSLLSNLTLGKNSELNINCFSKCIGLTKIVVPEGCTLYQNAIANCADEETGKGLKEVVLEKNVKIHLTFALRGNTYLEKVTIKKPLLFGDGSTSGRSLFTGDSNLNTIYTDYTWEELQALKNFNNWGITITESMVKPIPQ